MERIDAPGWLALRRAALCAPVGVLLGAAPAEASPAWFWSDYYYSDMRDYAPVRPPIRRAQRPRRPAAKFVAPPESKPQGPIVIAISIEKQALKVYDANGVFAESPVSTGMRGHATPNGVFSVIQKNKWHRSNIYSGAPMPYMQRITWSGVALHAGVLPGYPASHGCIRMPASFATKLWGWTRLGARVVIAPGEVSPSDITHALLPQKKPQVTAALPAPSQAGASAPLVRHAEAGAATLTDAAATAEPAKPAAAIAPEPEGLPAPPVAAPKRNAHLAAFISRKDGKLYVRQDFRPLFDLPVTIAAGTEPLGTHVFTPKPDPAEAGALRWTALSMPAAPRRAEAALRADPRRVRPVAEAPAAAPLSAAEALDRITLPPDAASRLSEVLALGGSLVVSDLGIAAGETGEGTDFIVPLRAAP